MSLISARLRIDAGTGSRDVALADYLTPEAAEAADRHANRWIKSLRAARIDGAALRDRFTFRGDSLWWFAELYLHKTRAMVDVFSTIAALETLVARERPLAITMVAGDRILRTIAPQLARRLGLAFEDRAPRSRLGRASRPVTAARSWFYEASGVLRVALGRGGQSPEQRGQSPSTSPPPIAAFVHSAFWRKSGADDEAYIGPVLGELASRFPNGVRYVGLGPRTNFRARGWTARLRELGDRAFPIASIEEYATRRDIAPSTVFWRDRRPNLRAMEASDDLRAAAGIQGCDLWTVVRDELAGIADLQFPWSARAMDEAAAALERLRPGVVFTYAEAGGWGRALALECRRRGIPFVGLQHGFISRHWLNYLHESDELQPSRANPSDRGFPQPDLTLLYDGFAERHLIEHGRFPKERLRVVGNPRLDALVAAAARLTPADLEAARAAVGARPGQHLVVLAAKRIPEFDASFAALVAAVSGLPDVHLTMKPHPAETKAPYERLAAGAPNATVSPDSVSLVALTAAARLVATINSTAAIEAMALGVPALAMRLPNYLTPFVDSGAMAGTTTVDEIAPAVGALVYDDDVRAALARGTRAFIERYGIIGDGRAAARAAESIAALTKC